MFIQKVKKGAVLFGCLCMAMVPVTPMAVKADEMEQIQPYSESISRHTLVFDISNTGKARISANVVGKAGIANVSVKVILQKKSGGVWTDIKTWQTSKKGTYNKRVY